MLPRTRALSQNCDIPKKRKPQNYKDPEWFPNATTGRKKPKTMLPAALGRAPEEDAGRPHNRRQQDDSESDSEPKFNIEEPTRKQKLTAIVSAGQGCGNSSLRGSSLSSAAPLTDITMRNSLMVHGRATAKRFLIKKGRGGHFLVCREGTKKVTPQLMEQFRLPFRKGFKRVITYAPNNIVRISYYPPNSRKRLRTWPAIKAHLDQNPVGGLTEDNFIFAGVRLFDDEPLETEKNSHPYRKLF